MIHHARHAESGVGASPARPRRAGELSTVGGRRRTRQRRHLDDRNEDREGMGGNRRSVRPNFGITTGVAIPGCTVLLGAPDPSARVRHPGCAVPGRPTLGCHRFRHGPPRQTRRSALDEPSARLVAHAARPPECHAAAPASPPARPSSAARSAAARNWANTEATPASVSPPGVVVSMPRSSATDAEPMGRERSMTGKATKPTTSVRALGTPTQRPEPAAAHIAPHQSTRTDPDTAGRPGRWRSSAAAENGGRYRPAAIGQPRPVLVGLGCTGVPTRGATTRARAVRYELNARVQETPFLANADEWAGCPIPRLLERAATGRPGHPIRADPGARCRSPRDVRLARPVPRGRDPWWPSPKRRSGTRISTARARLAARS